VKINRIVFVVMLLVVTAACRKDTRPELTATFTINKQVENSVNLFDSSTRDPFDFDCACYHCILYFTREGFFVVSKVDLIMLKDTTWTGRFCVDHVSGLEVYHLIELIRPVEVSDDPFKPFAGPYFTESEMTPGVYHKQSEEDIWKELHDERQ
jgi:hypothetical protein